MASGDSIEYRTQDHRATIRKMVWGKYGVALIIAAVGWLIPWMIQIDYMTYFGIALRWSTLILLIQGLRTIKEYRYINKYIIPKTHYSEDDVKQIRATVTTEIAKNKVESRIALVMLILCVIISILAILLWSQSTITTSFMPIAIILGVEFGFTLLLIHKQKKFASTLD